MEEIMYMLLLDVTNVSEFIVSFSNQFHCPFKAAVQWKGT